MAIVKQEGNFVSSDKINQISYTKWVDSAAKPRAVLLIAHGMAEHIERYDDFATFMAGNGYIVYGEDHIGHGCSATDDQKLGNLPKKTGRYNMVDDMLTLDMIAKEEHPGLKVILLGHSMGSFIARIFCVRHPKEVDGAIFMGTGGKNPVAGIGVFLINIIALFKGENHRSPFVDNMAFGSYNKGFSDVQTPKDWLSTDRAIVQKYIDDPKCGYLFTLSGYRELTTMVKEINTPAWAAALPKELPMLLVSGAEDPVGANGKGVQEVYAAIHNAGAEDVGMILYDGMRHEILNEQGKQAVYDDLLEWCNRVTEK